PAVCVPIWLASCVLPRLLARGESRLPPHLPSLSSLRSAPYAPQVFIAHAALLHQAFAHCAIFPSAASRSSLDRVSVPMWPITLSGRLLIVALVSRYLTN